MTILELHDEIQWTRFDDGTVEGVCLTCGASVQRKGGKITRRSDPVITRYNAIADRMTPDEKMDMLDDLNSRPRHDWTYIPTGDLNISGNVRCRIGDK